MPYKFRINTFGRKVLDFYGAAKNTVIQTLKVGNILGGNYSEIQADGTYKSYGDATSWDDLRVPLVATNRLGSQDPQFTKMKDNGSGSQGVFAYSFSPTSEQELYFMVQLPHSYKLGSDLYPHIHWIPSADGAEGKKVSWGLECSHAEIGDIFGDTTIISGNEIHDGDTALVANKHYLTSLGTIDGSSIDSVSKMFVCRIFRDATGALKTDDYPAAAFGLEFDIHYEVDTFGSQELYTKY